MAVTTKSEAAMRCRKNVLSLMLLLSALAGAFGTMAALAQSVVTNTATVAPPAGTADPDPDNDSDDAVLSVAPLAAAYDFCPAGPGAIFSLVNGVGIWRYDAGAGADAAVPELDAAISGDLNGLMIDPVRNRLLFISRSGTDIVLWAYDAANGGWYQAAPAFSAPDFPRAGMTSGGVGYLIAGNNTTPEVWEVTADPTPGSFGYAVNNIGNLSYDQAPSNTSSGDIAFDGNGVAWLSAGVDLYKVDLAGGSLVAERQVRPLLNGAPSGINWAGVAFAADGTLYVADNTASSAYYAYDPATGVLTQAVSTGAGGSRDLASCAFPVLADPQLSVAKTLAEVNGAAPTPGAPVQAGDVLTYAITVANTGGTVGTLFEGDVVETLPDGTAYVAAGNDFTCAGSSCPNSGAFNIAAGADVTLDFVVEIDEPLPPGVDSIANAVTVVGVDCDAPGNDCEETTPIGSAVAVVKSAEPATGASVAAGDTITYTLTATILGGATTGLFELTDTLDAGLSFGAVTDAGDFACTGALQCSLPTGTVQGTYTVTYTATVDADATGTVGNSVAITGDGGDPDPECTTCSTTHGIGLPVISTVKSADPADGSRVQAGQLLTYTLTTTVATSATTEPYLLTDTLGAGLTLVEVTDAGAYTCSDALVCTLPAGTVPGTYAVTYTATVDADATDAVANSVVGVGGGDPDPECTDCSTEHDIALPGIATVKTADPADGAEVSAGDVLTYTLTTTVAMSATTAPYVLTDTLGEGLTLLPDSIEVGEGGSCEPTGNGLVCTLAAGALPGNHVFTYQARVDADAVGAVGNSVTGAGGGDPDPECADCSTEHPLAEPVVTVAKTSDPGDGAEVRVGDTIVYTLSVTVENAAITTPVLLTDTPGAGLTVGALPAGCTGGDGAIVCTLAAGAVPGTHAFSYPTTVDANAAGEVTNAVVSEYGGAIEAVCQPCGTSHRVLDDTELRIVKTAGVRSARIGDLVRYTLTVENVGVVNLVGGTVVDTPPQGFSYVEGSMTVEDGDDAFELAAGRHPLGIGGLDIAVGERATIVYLLRVGAGVRHGIQVNEALARNGSGNPISNVATAQVTIESDPLLDDSLVFGTVFDDRDGDGWQDSAALSGVRVQGGFAPGAYVAGSTTLERGVGTEPVADASAPLLHGIEVGRIAARQSAADPADARQVVIRQRLNEAAFTDDFVLTSDQGVTVRMDAAGRTTVERSGAAARGLNAAEPTVERRIAQGEGGVVVDYVIGNAGIDERGIPGVRIASVEGLLVETDQYGRYHLLDVQGGERDYRNFILKVDPSTLPPGTAFTTDNPLLRRITSGVPVRFDFGVQLPVVAIPGGSHTVELNLGEVIFAPDSAEVRPEYLPAIAEMAGQVNAHGGGAVAITADGDSQALAFDRAGAVRDLLLAQVAPEHRDTLTVEVRTEVHDALVAGVNQSGALLGTVLFDTDSAGLRPEFQPLLDRVAARLEQLGGGAVALVGHTDARGSHAYNAELGLRRARAVYQALAERLSPELRARVRVESSNDPTAPVGPESK
ncbi:isopeptide-forming domain-containing fimbrial protein [Luteimonas sp. RD2P54]|uniref:Isopeptide-forming domain-containing fimbrial protein n=1 Tax=Luteimonas endophytica TaxID=3042023 RepID=A0ABT6J6F8_9GAMM|nr:isopeptide-forming domain-containing fimbrial protein [Luteimonas endophytica]MDH5822406.1 isopeptide-forming domain-containing fimbrial protein [Luteimonas endophytica]